MLLRDQDRDLLKKLFKNTNVAFEIWVYGSRVNGHAHEASDLDLVLRTPDLSAMDFSIFYYFLSA